jgi:putative Ca2+/H+ antiporter (TMEM165/GDT1 family)
MLNHSFPLSAAILSMRHPRLTIFSGSLAALAVMSLLSSLLGTIVPTLLPKRYTTAAAALLFFIFGSRMLQEGLEMDAGEKGREKMEEEMREVQKEVEEAEEEVLGGAKGGQSYALTDLEEGRISPVAAQSTSAALSGRSRKGSLSMPSKEDALSGLKEGAKNLGNLFFSPIFVQAFILTFLAEWGDRSQITTIALAAAHVSLRVFLWCEEEWRLITLSRAERLARHVRDDTWTLVLHHARRPRWSLDLATRLHQTWCVSSLLEWGASVT